MTFRSRLIRALARYNTLTPPNAQRRAKVEVLVLSAFVVAAIMWDRL